MASKGVELVEGDWADSAAMTRALNGVEGAYLMMPPIQTPSRDFREAKAISPAIRKLWQDLRRPGSSCCRPWVRRSPPASALLLQRTCSSRLSAANRSPSHSCAPGSFFENYLFGLQAAQGGTLPIFYAPTDRKLPMIATNDIGAEIAQPAYFRFDREAHHRARLHGQRR